jgi:hypothetical protein
MGVGMLLESAAHALTAGRFLQALGAETGNAEHFKQATTLGVVARQHELAAWELAAREAESRPKANPVEELFARFGTRRPNAT